MAIPTFNVVVFAFVNLNRNNAQQGSFNVNMTFTNLLSQVHITTSTNDPTGNQIKPKGQIGRGLPDPNPHVHAV